MIWPILEARAGIQKYFCSLSGSNEILNLSVGKNSHLHHLCSSKLQEWGHTNQPKYLILLSFFFQVRGGIYRQNSLVFSETVRKLESIYIYPEYNDRNILHDIALAKLDRPFDMDTFTASVCMPPKLDLFADKEEIGKTLIFPSNHCAFVNFRYVNWLPASAFYS